MKLEFIDLVRKEYAQDDYGVLRDTETIIKDIPCTVSSATSMEWFEGGRNGLNPQYKFTVKTINYGGEETVIYGGIRYAVYRTYIKEKSIELHCQREVGA